MGAGVELIECTCFLKVDCGPGTSFRFDHRLKPGYFSAGEEGYVQRHNFGADLPMARY